MKVYKDLLREIYETGYEKDDRTGTGTTSSFGHSMRFDLTNNKLPIITGKRIHLKSIIHELIWMLSGDTNIRYLKANGVRIWDEWVKPGTEVYDDSKNLIAGELGPVYGSMWRNIDDTRIVNESDRTFDRSKYELQGEYFDIVTGEKKEVYHRTIDQIANVIDLLKNDPDSRRIVVNSWQVPYLDEMALTPCHHMFQFWTRKLDLKERIELYTLNGAKDIPRDTTKDKLHDVLTILGIPERALSCKFDMRSNDMFLGNPFNITFYALLTHALANQLNMVASELYYTGGDCHIYDNHHEQVDEQLSRDIFANTAEIWFNEVKDIRDLKYEDFIIGNYKSHPAIKAPVAI